MFIFFFLIFIVPAFALTDPEHEVAVKIKEFVIAKYPHWAAEDIRITFKYPEETFDKMGELGEKAAVRIGKVNNLFRPVGNAIFPIEVKQNNNITRFLVRAKVEVFKKIVVAANTIKRAQVIIEEDVTIEARDVALLPEKYFYTVSDVFNREAKSTISKKSAIFDWMIKKKPLLHRGEKVTILVISDGVKIEAKGTTLSEGNKGEEIMVKRDDSKKSIKAKIISADKVEVKL